MGGDFSCAISSVLALTVTKGNGQNYSALLRKPLLTARLVVSIGTPFSAIKRWFLICIAHSLILADWAQLFKRWIALSNV